MQKIFLIRHARTGDNQEKRFSGRIESEVIQTQEEIRNIIFPKLMNEEIGQVYTSPRKRAVATAKSITNDYIKDEGLREINFGDFEGLTIEEITESNPEEFDKWIEKQNDYEFPNGDSLNSFYYRVIQEFERIIDQSDKNKNITIFTHGGTIQCIISHLLSKNLDHFWSFKIDNCSVSTFYFIEDTVVFEKVNS